MSLNSRPGRWPGHPTGRWPKRPHVPSGPSPPPPPLGDTFMTIRLEDLVDDKDALASKKNAKITEVAVIASYSWVKGSEPAIITPGKPPRWTPRPGTVILQPDRGPVYRDANASRYPPHPLEAAVIVALDAEPTLPTEVDIVCCASTIGNLLRFVRRLELEAIMSSPNPKSSGSAEIKPFRILVEQVGNTVFFTRRENDPMTKIEPLLGFGHSFPEAYTTWDDGCEGSTSNQRILRYRFGGMGIALRFECDGYIPSGCGEAEGNRKSSKSVNDGANLDDLTTALERTSVSTASNLTKFTNSKEIKVTRPSTSLIPQSDVFDLKTRSWRKKGVDIVAEEIQRLWVAQVSRFVLAFHQDGRFTEEDISVMDVGTRIKEWEAEHEEDMKRLGTLMRKLVEIAKQRGKAEICYDPQFADGPGEGKELLVLREMLEDAGTVLSVDTKERWLKGPDSNEPGARRLVDSDDEDGDRDLDYTACDADSCGYCGRCSY